MSQVTAAEIDGGSWHKPPTGQWSVWPTYASDLMKFSLHAFVQLVSLSVLSLLLCSFVGQAAPMSAHTTCDWLSQDFIINCLLLSGTVIDDVPLTTANLSEHGSQSVAQHTGSFTVSWDECEDRLLDLDVKGRYAGEFSSFAAHGNRENTNDVFINGLKVGMIIKKMMCSLVHKSLEYVKFTVCCQTTLSTVRPVNMFWCRWTN